MIYLATPYSDSDKEVMERRFEQACAIAARYMNEGTVVYSPIVHCHPIAVRHELPRDWAFWGKFDRQMIAKATKVVVVKMDGWEKSKGIAAEVAIAVELGIPVEHIEA